LSDAEQVEALRVQLSDSIAAARDIALVRAMCCEELDRAVADAGLVPEC